MTELSYKNERYVYTKYRKQIKTWKLKAIYDFLEIFVFFFLFFFVVYCYVVLGLIMVVHHYFIGKKNFLCAPNSNAKHIQRDVTGKYYNLDMCKYKIFFENNYTVKQSGCFRFLFYFPVWFCLILFLFASFYLAQLRDLMRFI